MTASEWTKRLQQWHNGYEEDDDSATKYKSANKEDGTKWTDTQIVFTFKFLDKLQLYTEKKTMLNR